MNPALFEDALCCWNNAVLDDYSYSSINDFDVSDFYLTSLPSPNATTAGFSLNVDASLQKGLKRARDHEKTCFQSESKASREKLRREKMNDRFSELRHFLSPERPARSDKSSILHDAICAVYKLKSEHQELKQRKKKLQDDTLSLKDEKNELREEKLNLQERKQKVEQQLKGTPVAVAPQSGYVPLMQHAGGHKGIFVSGYGGYPMWQWIPHSVLDISKDHVLRPPVA